MAGFFFYTHSLTGFLKNRFPFTFGTVKPRTMLPGQDRMKALSMLVLATFFWGTSFILMKALVVLQQELVPANTWHLTALSLVLRFGLAGLLLLFWNMRQLRKMTWLEFYEGAGLGVVGGLGLLFQMDGVNHTSASTAAFL